MWGWGTSFDSEEERAFLARRIALYARQCAAFFATLTALDRFLIYSRIAGIKTPAIRAARVADVVEKAARGEQHYR